ncbi:hypothetical protein RclHR1_12740003 [Rhizophagus clarus]|uniref:RRM domain-containing protein n=2 Tax=Rhizophagus clarus TaxID=94130 RepID=A0A2Z6Q806_9GLOM|nr:hypothetical protein RclHR1_12740003 [Rhizophagus clarus]
MVDQKSSCREFVATLIQLPPNTKDINLAPLTRDFGTKAVNVPLFLNSYKPKRWAYVTFNSQETMDAAMEQIISFRDHTLQWNLPNDTNKLCHRCGKLRCAPNQCPSCQQRDHTRDRNPVAAFKERFNINQPARSKAHSRSDSRSRSRFKGPDNSRSSQSLSFSTTLRTPPLSSSRNQPITISPHEAANILSLLKALQQDMAEVRNRITALELNDRRMICIEQHLGLLFPPVIPANNQASDMLIDPPANTTPIVTQVSSQPAALTAQKPLNSLLPSFIPSRPDKTPISASSTVAIPTSSSSSSTPNMVSSPTQTHDKIQAINAKHSAIENKLDMLANSISGFIRSITSSSSSSNSVSTAGSN